VSLSWCKVASNLDSHPKIRKAGRNGREVFLFALRRNAEPGNPVPGRLPLEMLEDWYLADQLMMSRDEAVTGVTAAVTAGLLARDGNEWVIVGWDHDWGKTAVPGNERTKRWREKKQLADGVTARDARDVTESHGDACDALDQRRGEETRGEEKREEQKTPVVPKGDASPLDQLKSKVDAATGEVGRKRARKPKPVIATEHREAAIRLLGKLSEHNGVAYTGTDTHVGLIARQLDRGVTELELRAVVAYCAADLEWRDDERMRQYLRPETLFGPESIAKYLDPARTRYADVIAEHSKPALKLVTEGG
jgi:uncharacterized phage protein (TIGR02220 family)